MTSSRPSTARLIGRYFMHAPIAAGGMGTVHLGALLGEAGFQRTVAIKRLNREWVGEHAFEEGLLEEAKLAARIQHPNVIRTVDLIRADGEVFVVMDYVEGESLSQLIVLASRRGVTIPVEISVAIIIDALRGLHAAHTARSKQGRRLVIVHRDVSPQNILVGTDGLSRVLDFGIAEGREQKTRRGDDAVIYDDELKGKLSYMAPEQLHGVATVRTDGYAAAVVLWELLTLRRLFDVDELYEAVALIEAGDVVPPSVHAPEVSPELDAIVLKGLSRDPADRFASASAFAEALEDCVRAERATRVASWLRELASEVLAKRTAQLELLERELGDGAASSVLVESLAGSSGESLLVDLPANPEAATMREGADASADQRTDAARSEDAPAEESSRDPHPFQQSTMVSREGSPLSTPQLVTEEPTVVSRGGVRLQPKVGPDAARIVRQRKWILAATLVLAGTGTWAAIRDAQGPEPSSRALVPDGASAAPLGDRASTAVDDQPLAATPSVFGAPSQAPPDIPSAAPRLKRTVSSTGKGATRRVTPRAVSSVGALASSVATSRPSPPVKTAATVKRPPPPPLHNPCDPPYTVDANGIRRLKPACM